MTATIRILIVGDSEADAELMLRELSRGGYDPVAERVETADALRAALDANTWDVIVSDYEMPRFNALEALEIVKASGHDVPFLVVSGVIGEDLAVAAVKAGAHDYIMKDRLARLVPAIERAIREAGERRERRHTRERLRESEEQVRIIADNLPVLIINLDSEQRFRFVNKTCEEWFGRPRAEIVGKRIKDLFGEAEYEGFRPHVEMILAGKNAVFEQAVTYPDGVTRNVQAICVPQFGPDGEVRGFFALVQDVSERTHVEEALRESEARIRAVMENVADCVVTIDDTGRIESFNAAAERTFGYAESEVVGRNVAMLMNDADKSQHDSYLQRFLDTGIGKIIGVGPRELTGRRKDGSTVPVELAVSEMTVGKKRMFIGAMRDITERKLAEDMSRQHERELARLLRRNTVGEMAAALAHEINQPLASIVNFSRGCARRFRSGNWKSDEILNALDEISEQAERASSIIRHIGEFIHSPEPKRTLADINDLVRSVATLTEAEFGIHGVKVTFELADGLPPVSVSVIEIEQVVLNLMMNSLDAMKETGRGDREIVIQTSLARRDAVEVAVRDVGAGLDGGMLDMVFDPYFTTKENGMGLGLSISRTIIDAHGGKLSAGLNADRGATFHFTLPAQRENRGKVR